jgi:NADP-dependent 3-hydroxy acid dehydrogenase YdfG
VQTLRLELNGLPVRVTEITPGMMRDDETDCIAWCATRPAHVDIDLIEVRPLAQASQTKVHRTR